MTTLARELRPPGVAFRQPEARRRLAAVRLDTCAFVGVTRRGPCRVPTAEPGTPGRVRRSVPVLVEGWDEFALRFGGMGGPGLLPSAVAAFFANGGSRAYVIRIVHEHGGPENDLARAHSSLAGLVDLASATAPRVLAADEGAWGNDLTVAGVLRLRTVRAVRGADHALTLAAGQSVPAGARLRLRVDGAESHHWVRARSTDRLTGLVALTLDAPVPCFDLARAAGPCGPASVRVEEVLVDLTVQLAPESLVEHHDGLGLDPVHPRYVGSVLAADSVVLRLREGTGRIEPVGLGGDVRIASGEFVEGVDRDAAVVPEDFFHGSGVPGRSWVPGDEPGEGLHAITDHTDVGLLCLPDLYCPFPAVEDAEVADPSLGGAQFAECVGAAPWMQGDRADDLAGLRRDPQLDLDSIVALQQQVVTLAEQLAGPVALLDVPPGLTESGIRAWRGSLTSSYAAAYHPWLRVPRGDRLATTTPSAAAAGVIAARELRDGIPTGPANEIVVGAVDVSDAVDPVGHGELHHLGINVLARERDGVRLTGARTLSHDPHLRQLSVRRLMVAIRRTLEQRMQWVAFESHHHLLRADVRHVVRTFLRGLARQGAFAGATEDESFFVRCDESTNPPWVVDAGRLVVEVGVAPAHPMEFIEVTLSFDGDATARAEETHG